MSFTVLNSAGPTVTIVATNLGNATTEIMQSIPTNTLGTPMIGQAASASSIPVVIANDQSNVTVAAVESGTWTVQALEAGTWTVQALEAGTWTVQALQAGSWTAQQGGAPWSQNITQIGGVAVALGSTTSASSIPVVIASNQSAVPISGTVTAVLSGGILAATSFTTVTA